jgi:hypothetical protein
MQTTTEALIIWVDRKTGCQLHGKDVVWNNDTVQLRSAGAGWRWHDFEGNEWGTGSGPHGIMWRIEHHRGAR